MIEHIPPAPPAVPVNRHARTSLTTGLLTLFSVCIAVAPIPFTGYVCYPAAALLGVVALVTGAMALWQIRTTREDGHTYALIGIWIGGITLLATLCATGLGILLYPKVVSLIHQYLK